MNTFLLVSIANLVQVMRFDPSCSERYHDFVFIDPGAYGTITQPSNGICTREDADIAYTPNPDFCGVDQFTYTVTHPTSGADTANVIVSVLCPNPIANDDFATTSQGKSVVLFVLSNDTFPPGKMK